MTDQLLTIKLYPPTPRPGQVDRPRLLSKLTQGLQQGRRLTLISAPAGYGKTTLVSEWLQTLDRPIAWLSLEPIDNEPLQFFSYLMAAMQQVDKQIGQAFQTALEQSNQSEVSTGWLQAQLPALLNEINHSRTPFVLIFDDYHSIVELEIHEAIGFLLDHLLPGTLHLVIITRQDPLLRLSRLRSQGQVTEIRMGELRFTEEEAGAFFNQTMCLDLQPEQVAALEARTEGWIAGLQLAAISLSESAYSGEMGFEPDQRAEFIRAFAGDDHHVVDYLMDEVLTRQPEPVQRFLLYTSILKRFTAPLCDYLINWQEAGEEPRFTAPASSPAILDYLEKSNIFLISLDNHRQWYRYHHLFAELLGTRFQTIHPELVAGLHRRASFWFEQAGMTDDAVDHALLAEDFSRALGLIEQAARTSIWASGDLPALLNWTKRLPQELLRSRPNLCLYCARGLFFAGQIKPAEEYLRTAAQALDGRSPNDPMTQELRGVLYTNQATFAAVCGESQHALALAEKAAPFLSRLPEDEPSSHARILHAVGMAEYLAGRVRPAAEAFTRAVSLAQQAGNRNLGLDVVGCLGLTLLLSGKARQAGQVCEQAFVIDEAGRMTPPASAVYIAEGEVLYAQNELAPALQKLELGLELGKKAGWVHVIWRGLAMLSAVKLGLGDIPGVMDALQQFEQTALRYDNPAVNILIDAWKVRMALALGDRQAADRWAENFPTQAEAQAFGEFRAMTLARVLLAQGRYSQALVLMDKWLASAVSEERGHSVIEIQILRSIGLRELGKPDEALAALSEALELAEPEGISRLFLDRLEPLADLLRQVRREKAGPSIRRFVDRLLARIDQPMLPQPGFQTVNETPGDLVEPLSEREIEVLRLIAEGLSNPEIAGKLFLSVNTLRAHSSHIFQKLDVHNRVQAVARARELGILKP